MVFDVNNRGRNMINNIRKLSSLGILLGSLLVTQQASAGLIVRDGGMVYDDVLDITWLQDANFAKTSAAANADSSGKMNWLDANSWAASLSFGGYDDWRLASYETQNSDKSELGYMFTDNLSNSGSLINKSFIDASSGESHSFENLFGSRYWTDISASDTKAWSFSFSNGSENGNKLKTDVYKSWAVRDGDISLTAPITTVSEPSTFAILCFSIMGLLFMTNRKHKV